jgi:hypothetical protein
MKKNMQQTNVNMQQMLQDIGGVVTTKVGELDGNIKILSNQISEQGISLSSRLDVLEKANRDRDSGWGGMMGDNNQQYVQQRSGGGGMTSDNNQQYVQQRSGGGGVMGDNNQQYVQQRSGGGGVMGDTNQQYVQQRSGGGVEGAYLMGRGPPMAPPPHPPLMGSDTNQHVQKENSNNVQYLQMQAMYNQGARAAQRSESDRQNMLYESFFMMNNNNN